MNMKWFSVAANKQEIRFQKKKRKSKKFKIYEHQTYINLHMKYGSFRFV